MKKFKYLLFIFLGLFLFNPIDSYAVDYGNIGVAFSDASGNVLYEVNGNDYNIELNVQNVKYILMYTDSSTIKSNGYNLFYDFAIGYQGLQYPIGFNVSYLLENRSEINFTSSIFNADSQVMGANGFYSRYHLNVEFVANSSNAWYQLTLTLPTEMNFTFYSVYNKKFTQISGNSSSQIESSSQDIINNQDKNTDKIIENDNKNHEEAEESRKGIWDSILELPQKIGNLLKDLFIPDDGYFEDQFNVLKDNITDVLGFLAFPFVLVIDTFEFFLTIEDTGSYVIRWPDIPVPNFENHNIINAGQFDFADLLQNPVINGLRNLSLVFINVYILLAFLQLCHNKYTRVFGGDTSEIEFISVSDEYDVDYSTGEVTGMKHIEKKTRRRDVN